MIETEEGFCFMAENGLPFGYINQCIVMKKLSGLNV